MKYFIISDKQDVINKINDIVIEYSSFSFIGSSNVYDDVMNVFLKERPSLVLFDIDNFSTSPEVFINELNQFMDVLPLFIGVSSNKEKAYDAIKYDFIDYLLMPLSELDIRKSLLKFQGKVSKKKTSLCLKSYKDYQYIDTDQVIFLKADNNTTEFYINDGNVINAFKTLKTFENKLPNNFLRVHKSYIVNIDYISRISYGKNNCTLKSVDQFTIPFTKTYLNNIELIQEQLRQTLVA